MIPAIVANLSIFSTITRRVIVNEIVADTALVTILHNDGDYSGLIHTVSRSDLSNFHTEMVAE